MPDPITSAIVSSVISSVIEGVLTPAPYVPPTGIYRIMPQESRIGLMQPPLLAQWAVDIDGKLYPLSPGVQVRNELNFLVPASMVQYPVKVRFQLDPTGAVSRVWMLSALEASLPENR